MSTAIIIILGVLLVLAVIALWLAVGIALAQRKDAEAVAFKRDRDLAHIIQLRRHLARVKHARDDFRKAYDYYAEIIPEVEHERDIARENANRYLAQRDIARLDNYRLQTHLSHSRHTIEVMIERHAQQIEALEDAEARSTLRIVSICCAWIAQSTALWDELAACKTLSDFRALVVKTKDQSLDRVNLVPLVAERMYGDGTHEDWITTEDGSPNSTCYDLARRVLGVTVENGEVRYG